MKNKKRIVKSKWFVKCFLPLLLVCLSLLCFPHIIFAADVFINEYYPNPQGSGETSEWIELFNATDSEIDLSGWKIDDITDGGSVSYTIASGSSVPAKGFFILERSVTGIILNNDSDTIRLLNKSDIVIDEYIYNETEEGIFYGRKTDGAPEWVEFTSETKNRTNNGGILIATQANTPVPSVKPTNTQTPSKTLAPTKVITNNPLPTYSLIPTKKLTPSIKKTLTLNKVSALRKNEQQILGDNSDKMPSDYEKSGENVNTKSNYSINPGIVFISLGGIFLIACGILLFYKRKESNPA